MCNRSQLKLSTPATNQHCGWHLYFDAIAYTHSPVIVLVLSAFCRALASLRERCCNEIYYRNNASQTVSGLSIGKLGICLRRQNFNLRDDVLKYLSWALSTVFLAFHDHFSLHKNNQNVWQTGFLRPKYTNYVFRGRGSARVLTASFFSVLCTVEFCK